MAKYTDDEIREEFADWIISAADDIDEDIIKDNTTRKYYVYALCEKIDGGSLKPFYIGKGTGGRVWNHADETEEEKKEIYEEAKRDKLSEEEIQNRLKTVSRKHDRINEIGDRLVKIIVKSGLTEYESFMCESALINLLRLEGLDYQNDGELTNIVNGHANVFEKSYEIKTEALPVETYFHKYCKRPVNISELTKDEKKDFCGKKILLQNINSFYPDCVNNEVFKTPKEQNEAIREAVRAFWVNGDPKKMDYVFAMYHKRVVGVYKVKKIYKNENTFYSALDFWQEDYPNFDKLEGRRKDRVFAKTLYDVLISNNIIDENNHSYPSAKIRKQLYTLLDDKSKQAVSALFKEEDVSAWLKNRKLQDTSSNREEFYNNNLHNWSNRKYFVLEDLEDDTDPDFSKYIGCQIKEKRADGEIVSVFTGAKFTDKNGKQKRAKPFNFVYLSL